MHADQKSNPWLAAAALAVFVFLQAPLLIIAAAAFSDTTFLAFPPRGFTWDWFANVFEVSAFRRTFWLSLQLAFLATTISLMLGIPAAYAMRKYGVKLPGFLSTIFILPILVPEIVFGFAMLQWLAAELRWPVFPTLLIAHSLIILPYSVRVVSASLATFDFAAQEAAVSLGCPPTRAFFAVVLPNIRAGILAAFILAFITSLNNVPVSLFLIGPGVSTLPIQMLTYVENFFDPTVAALSVLLMLFTVVVMIIVERTLGIGYFVR